MEAMFRLLLPSLAWVGMGISGFDANRLVKRVIEAATKQKKSKLTAMKELQSELRTCLDGKKYLLVINNIWNTNSVIWKQFENLLKGGAKGSVILATTREKDVASIMGADLKYQYELKEFRRYFVRILNAWNDSFDLPFSLRALKFKNEVIQVESVAERELLTLCDHRLVEAYIRMPTICFEGKLNLSELDIRFSLKGIFEKVLGTTTHTLGSRFVSI